MPGQASKKVSNGNGWTTWFTRLIVAGLLGWLGWLSMQLVEIKTSLSSRPCLRSEEFVRLTEEMKSNCQKGYANAVADQDAISSQITLVSSKLDDISKQVVDNAIKLAALQEIVNGLRKDQHQ